MTISKKPRKQLKTSYETYRDFCQASNAIARAKYIGQMQKASAYLCQSCHKQADSYHHPSYREDDRLCVVALCTKCHMRHHKSGLKLPHLGTVPTAVGIIRIAIAHPT